MKKKTKIPKEKREPMEAVLDTNILIHDPSSMLQFKEHDVTITSIVIDELDSVKKKNESKASVITQVLVQLENFAKMPSTKQIGEPALYHEGVSLGKNKGILRVVKVNLGLKSEVSNFYSAKKTDHLILSSILELQKRRDSESKDNKDNKVPLRKVVLITKDRDLRIKAGTLGIPVEEYRNDKLDINYVLGNNVLTRKKLEPVIAELYRHPVPIEAIKGIVKKDTLFPNKYLVLKKNADSNETLCHITPDGKFIKVIKEKLCVSKINPLNIGQICAAHAVMAPEMDLILLEGIAGSGKTLMAMAAGFELMSQPNTPYKEMILTSAMVAVGNKEMGALPGNAQEKVLPYMAGLIRNLKLLEKTANMQYKIEDEVEQRKDLKKKKTTKRAVAGSKQKTDNSKNYQEEATSIKFFEGQVIIQPIAFVRGATFDNAIVIVDECQNLEKHEVKSIVTRAGKFAKMILCGDIHQIDVRYLDKTSNGLTHVINKLKGLEKTAFVKLPDGERSWLATIAAQLL